MRVREVILGLAVFILTLFVTTYGVNMFYPDVRYGDFCNVKLVGQVLSEEDCLSMGGEWMRVDGKNLTGQRGYCDFYSGCSKDYEEERAVRSFWVFLISLVLGILLLLGGAHFFSLDVISVGVMLGGVGTIIRGVGSYWGYQEDWFRFLISLIGLVAVIWFTYKFRDKLGFGGEKKLGKRRKRG